MSGLLRADHRDQTVRHVAAFPDAVVARDVVGDLARAGLARSTTMVVSPAAATDEPPLAEPVARWLAQPLPDRRWRSLSRALSHPVLFAALAALFLGSVTAVAALIWANPGSWLMHGAVGALAGAVAGSLARAAGALDAPELHPDFLGAPIGAVTVEVETDDVTTAEVARVLMARHGPTRFRSESRPAPRPPVEQVMWEHEEGISPLVALSRWVEGRPESGPRHTRGRPWKETVRGLLAEGPRVDRRRR